MELLLRIDSRLANRYVIAIVLLVLLGAGYAYVAGLDADGREELLYRVQEFLPHLSYRETVELAYYGASVIHPKTIKPLENKRIPLYVRSFLDNPADDIRAASDS